MKERIPALFLHIQKTAGTSIVQLAAKHYGNTNISSHGDFVGKSGPLEFKNIEFISGHFGFSFAKELMPGRYSFTFLRDPVDRTLSFYYFCKTRNPDELPIYKKAHALSLDEFVGASLEDRLIRSRIWNSQAWRLASGPYNGDESVKNIPDDELLELALHNSKLFSHVGLTETFETDLPIILRALGIENQPPPHANSTPSRLVRDELPHQTIRMIEEITQIDQKLYNTIKQRRTHQP